MKSLLEEREQLLRVLYCDEDETLSSVERRRIKRRLKCMYKAYIPKRLLIVAKKLRRLEDII